MRTPENMTQSMSWCWMQQRNHPGFIVSGTTRTPGPRSASAFNTSITPNGTTFLQTTQNFRLQAPRSICPTCSKCSGRSKAHGAMLRRSKTQTMTKRISRRPEVALELAKRPSAECWVPWNLPCGVWQQTESHLCTRMRLKIQKIC